MQKIKTAFSGVANNLIDRWRVLNCYVAPAQQGKVCWTFGVKSKDELSKKTGRNIFLGLNLTIGVPMTTAYSDFDYTQYRNYGFGRGIAPKLGIDFAWPVANKFAIGFYINGGPNLTFSNYLCERREYLTDYYDYDYEHNKLYVGFDVKVG